jgi:hypothetical protein
MSKCMFDATEHEVSDWKWVRDWMGDDTVPNGTMDCSHWECRKCSEEPDDDDLLPEPDDGY